MSNSSRMRTMSDHLRKVCAVLPAIALIGGGVGLTALAEPAPTIKGVAVSNDSPAIVVPDIALTMPAVPAPISTPNPADPFAAAPREAPAPVLSETPALVLPEGTGAGSSTPVTLDTRGIPVRALEGYRGAVALIDAADPACHIDWALLAAIGRVESDHARFGGNQLDSAGVAQPGIIGKPLDGSNGTALITDSDGGQLDRDTVYDRAVGPMQFIPGTWRAVGTDADGDGAKNPQDMADAAAATAIYLCSGPGDLSQPGDLRSAIMRYNASDSYVRTVTAIADAYRHGVTALPASDLPASNPPPVSSAPLTSVFALAPRMPAQNAPAGQPGPTPTVVSGQQPTVIPSAPAATQSTPAPAPRVTAPPATAPPTTPSTTPPATALPATAPPTTAPPTTPATPPPATAPPATAPPATAPPATAPPATVPPATVPPATAPPATAPPATTLPATCVPDPTPPILCPTPTPAPDPCLPDPTQPTPPPAPAAPPLTPPVVDSCTIVPLVSTATPTA